MDLELFSDKEALWENQDLWVLLQAGRSQILFLPFASFAIQRSWGLLQSTTGVPLEESPLWDHLPLIPVNAVKFIPLGGRNQWAGEEGC